MARPDSIEKAVGRLLLARLPGLDLPAASKAALENGTIGGIVLFKENGASLEQLASLTQAIISASHHVPIIAVDQEGGAIQRFDHFLTPLPSPMAIAATGSLETAGKMAALSAKQLKALGINCLLTPVLDVLSNALNPIIATRAFSDNPNKVSEFAKQVLQSINECGVVAVGKHFPGHGATLEDSHTDLAVNPAETRPLWQIDLLPFRNCIADMKAILTAHVWLSAVEEEPLPASLSKRVTQEILRNYLAFPGVIMTDDLTMKAITLKWGLEEAALMALLAGNDIAMVCASIDETLAVQKYIVEAVKSGRISEERILESGARVNATFKKRLSVPDQAGLEKLEKAIKKSNGESLAASQQAICQLRGEVPEIASGDWLVVVPNHARYPMRLVKALNDQVKKAPKGKFHNLQFTELRYSLDPSPEESQQLARECIERNCILLTYRSLANQGQMHLGHLIAENCRERIVASVDVPFDILGFPAWQNCLATFDPSEQAMRALANALLGFAAITGNCPVSLEFPIASHR